MKKIILGTKKDNTNYHFRETCFGIVKVANEYYLTKKDNEISLIGGGVEPNENHSECLKREFLEEAGLTITAIKEFITIDCFWLTRNNLNMESLANFYIVNVSKKIIPPTENESTLIKLNQDELLSKIVLPYQKEAIRLYLEEYH
jgi:8-oxo-dGTP diphosphatase